MRTRSAVVATVGAAVLFLTMLTASLLTGSPAHAAWSGDRCDNEPAPHGNAFKVCINLHTIPSGGGIKVDQVQLCVTRLQGGAKINGTYSNGVAFTGSAGNWISSISLLDTSGSGNCTYTNPFAANQMGNGACYGASGYVNLDNWPDDTWVIFGKVTGGAYDCG